MAASEVASSCGPQEKAQPPPPMAHVPKPTVVISRLLKPKARFGKFITHLIRVSYSLIKWRAWRSQQNRETPALQLPSCSRTSLSGYILALLFQYGKKRRDK